MENQEGINLLLLTNMLKPISIIETHQNIVLLADKALKYCIIYSFFGLFEPKITSYSQSSMKNLSLRSTHGTTKTRDTSIDLFCNIQVLW
jgi:hypothetical protein